MSKVKIERDIDVDVDDIIRHSAFAIAPQSATVLRGFMAQSLEVWVGKVDGEVACIFGLIPPSLLSDVAYLWLLTTEVADEHTFIFVRHSQQWMEQVKKRYERIQGHVMQDNPKAKRWLKWLGATIHEAEGGRHAFVIRSK